MGISIGLVGLGSFGSTFAPLFKSHPLVDRIGLCDTEAERVARIAGDPFYADKLDPRDCHDSLESICRADFDALAIITQPWLHAPQCIRALESGKDVYSAVPVIELPDGDEMLEWCDRLVRTVGRTGRHYMLGETTFYRPQAQFCRRQARAGLFGDFVYAEGEYFHDVDSECNLRQVHAARTTGGPGREWQAVARRYRESGRLSGPMHYPTHSCSGPVSVMRARAVKVAACGHRNREGDPFFAGWAFSNEVALFKMSNHAVARICEMRETPGRPGLDSEAFRIFGTRGSFAENRWWRIERPDPAAPGPRQPPRPEQRELAPREMFEPLPPEVELAFKRLRHRGMDEAELRDTEFQPWGHGGSHPYLVHEFVEAVARRRRPAIHVWEAVRYMAMGVAAHRSALRDGEWLPVPDWGDPP